MLENEKIPYYIRYTHATKLQNELPFPREKYFRITPKEENAAVLTLFLSKINECIGSKRTPLSSPSPPPLYYKHKEITKR